MEINVYSQYFRADCTYNGTPRKAALVHLKSNSEAGQICYSVNVNFFPYSEEGDYVETFDAFASETLYEGKGRRSKKKEALYMESFREHIDKLAQQMGGRVFWDQPLQDARWA